MCVQLTGTIPSELGSMPKLISIGFENHHMTGRLPQSFRYANCYLVV